jgi:hypothetical protein
VQACMQCGLSIGEAATFCPVCGTRVGDEAAVATAVEPAALVSELERGPTHVSEAGPDTVSLDAGPVTGHSAILDAAPDSGRAELVADLAAEHATGSEAEEPEPPAEGPEPPAEPEESPEDVRQRRMAELAALLELAGRFEEADPARAAVVYGEVVVGCLEVTDDPLGTEPVREDLLRGFDGLSLVLERQGLPEEALAVVDDAVSLGLLDGADGVTASQRISLRDRREGLRRILYGDWAQL